MSKYARRTDNTHAPIREALRKAFGRDAVIDTSRLGEGFPDLVVGVRGRTILVEAKTNQNPEGSRAGVRFRRSRTQEAQDELMRNWPGDAWVKIHDAQAAPAAVADVLSRLG